MNFFITSILSILTVSVYASSSSSSSSACESSFISDSCDITSSSSSCSYSSSSSISSARLCARELGKIEEQPCLPVVNYMRKLEAEVRAKAVNWLITSTRDETVKQFASRYGIVVRIYNAFGQGMAFPAEILLPKRNDFSILRAQALNKGVYDAGMASDVYYAFKLMNPDGNLMMVQFVVPRSQLPLNNIKYRRASLYN